MLFSRIILFCIFIALEIKSGSLKSKDSVLVRRKRYLVFPEGSTLSVSYFTLLQLYGGFYFINAFIMQIK